MMCDILLKFYSKEIHTRTRKD